MKENSIETLKKELEEKEKIFEEKYIKNVHNDYLSEEACKLRKDIWRLQSEIREKEREENSIEENIKNAEHFIKSIKTDKEYQEENGWHGYYNKEIVELARMLEHILSDYKRVLKENEQLSTEVNSLKGKLKEVRNK